MKRIIYLTIAILIFWSISGHAACAPKNSTEQTCTNTLTWNWEQGTGLANAGFIMQRQIAGGEWLDLATRPTEKTMIDVVTDTVGGQTISYRVMAYFDDGGRTGPSNVASMVTPVIQPARHFAVQTNLKTLRISRRKTNSSTQSFITVNKDTVVTCNGTVAPSTASSVTCP